MLIIGHRGAKGLAQENTMASFKAAIKSDVDGVELDVRTTADKFAVVAHDENIGSHTINKTNYEDLLSVNPNLLKLEEALGYLTERTSVVIEIKPGADIAPVAECISKYDTSRFTVSSFDFNILKRVKEQLPTVKLAVNEKWSGVRASRRARYLGTAYITMNQKWLWSGFIASVSKNGYKLSAYTLNDPYKAQKWALHGLFAAITDRPDRFKN